MITALTIDRVTGDGKYADVLDVCQELANGDYGSATNALIVMVRQSPLFKRTAQKAATNQAIEASSA